MLQFFVALPLIWKKKSAVVEDNHTIIFLGLMKNKVKWKARLFHTLIIAMVQFIYFLITIKLYY